MNIRHAALLPFAAGLLLSTSAYAALNATATTDLNMRQGPGPQYPVVGVIDANATAAVSGCLPDRNWCQVSYNGVQGWAYGTYLAARTGAQTQVVAQLPANEVPVVQYDAGATTGAVTGAVAGALIGGPVGAVIGGVVGANAGAAITPPAEVGTYVTQNEVSPVYLSGEVVVGAGIPQNIQLQPVPDYQYQYAYVNGQPVLVDPSNRRIVYVYR